MSCIKGLTQIKILIVLEKSALLIISDTSFRSEMYVMHATDYPELDLAESRMNLSKKQLYSCYRSKHERSKFQITWLANISRRSGVIPMATGQYALR